MSADGSPSGTKPLQQFFFKDGRLHPLCRLVLYLLVLAVAYFGIRPIPRLIVVALFGSWTTLPEMITLVGVIILGTWFTRRLIDKRDMASLGFTLRRGWSADFGIGLMLGAVSMGAVFLVELLFGWIEVIGFAWTAQSFATFASGLFTAAVSMLTVAVLEETFSRGYMLQTLEEAFGTPAAVLISSALFGLLHLINPSALGWADYVVPFTLTLAGVMFSIAYLGRRSLWLPIALHFAWNIFEYDIFALTGASTEHATFLATRITGPTLWVGLPNSSFGPEAGLLGVLAMLACIAALYAMKRRRAVQGRP